MATITVRPDLSPRLIIVDAPFTEISVQELVDQCRDWEDSMDGVSEPKLIDAAGKEELGGGVKVGITVTLQNAQLYFAARTEIHSQGTITTADARGETIIDSGGSFLTDAAIIGDTVFNATTGALATLIEVVSDTEYFHLPLEGGTRQTWLVSDEFRIYHNEQCAVEGGNVVATDALGAEINPILPSPNTQVVRSASSSATLSEQQEIQNIKFLVETLRPHHTGQGAVIYWNPDVGDDQFEGKSQARAVKTFARAHDLAGNGTHDTIMCVSGVSGQTIVDEHITISKNYLFVRGPGRDFRLKPTTATGATVTIDAVGVEVSGMVIDTADFGGQNAINILDGADFFFLDAVWSRDAQDDAVDIFGDVVYGRINNCFFSHPADVGIEMDGNVRHTKITNTELDACGGDGIRIEGVTARNNLIGTGTKIYDCGGYGIHIKDAVNKRNFIDADVSVYDNALGDIFDNGILTEDERRTAKRVQDIWRDMGLDADNPTAYTDDGTTTTKVSGDVTTKITDTSITRQ